MKTSNRSVIRSVAAFILFSFLLELITPAVTLALTSGPGQPEFSSFEPVATTGMVNEFSGSFNYNLPVLEIPGAGGGGYALSLSYHSGTTMDEDASWVGYGWTLNPGAITRNMRGLPDDYNGAKVSYYNRAPKNETYTIGLNVGVEGFSKDLKGVLGGDYSTMIRYNSYTGFSTVSGFSANVYGVASLGYSVEDGYGKFSASVNPANFLSRFNEQEKNAESGKQQGDATKDKAPRSGFKLYQQSLGAGDFISALSNYGVHMLSAPPYPTNTLKYSGGSYNVRLGLTGSPVPFIPGELGGRVGMFGNYTYQEGVGREDVNAYGYMYSGGASGVNDIMDYYTEKDVPYTKKDRYLGIPFSNADHYSLSGEGLGGGFRMFHRGVGIFRPNAKTNTTSLGDYSGDLGIGTAVGIGVEVSGGKQELKVQKWNGANEGSYSFKAYNNDEPSYFRFANDLGGNVLFAPNDEAVKADITSGRQPSIPGSKIYATQSQRSGRSSYIGYTKNLDMRSQTVSGVHYRSYTQDTVILNKYVSRGEWTTVRQGIGEFAVTNENGNRYVYGLPVYARFERSMQFGFDNPGNLSKRENSIVYNAKHEDVDNPVVTGELREAPYATTYLLTQITTPDFVDRTQNGPTPDDFGGYTRFSYKRTAGTTLKSRADRSLDRNNSLAWYKWRMPYAGLQYSTGTLSNGRDDRGSVSSGEKEVYYLSSVETKTHIAFFVTNKTDTVITINGKSRRLKGTGKAGKERLDAYEAPRNTNNRYDKLDELFSSSNGVGDQTSYDGIWKSSFDGLKFNRHVPDEIRVQTPKPNKMEYLERIELYAKDTDEFPGHLIKKVHFDYDYSTMKTGVGRYIDTIEYYNPFTSVHTTRYDSLYYFPTNLNSAVGFTTDDVFPAHAGHQLGGFRYGKLTLRKVWFEYEGVVNARISPYTFEYEYKQSSYYPSSIAAKYPEVVAHGDGGLEENPLYDETSVDRWGFYRADGATRSRNLQPYVDQTPPAGFDPAAWQLKVINLPSGGEIHVQYEQQDYSYVQDKRAMAMVSLVDQTALSYQVNGITHYNYKYKLNVDSDLGLATYAEKQQMVQLIRNEFITKREKIAFKFLYRFRDCGYSTSTTSFPGGVNEYITGYAQVKDVGIDNTDGKLWVTIGGDPSAIQLAKEYAKIHKLGNTFCGSPDIGFGGAPAGKGFWTSMLEMLPGVSVLFQAFDAFFGSSFTPYLNFSYLRLPLTKPKKGGGCRVKRILMYDKGLESGDAVLYGSEYTYTTTDETGAVVSSGVATNEPARGREENALVTFLPARDEQSWIEQIVAGKDLEQGEGPLGESILPAPSVGYSKVTVRNIHSGATKTGFIISEFYTAKDYPVKVYNTPMEPIETETPNPIFELMFGQTISRYWITQGYSCILNSMHGQPKNITKYGGDLANRKTWYAVESQEHTYYQPGETIPMMYDLDDIRQEYPGKEMEVVIESREITDIMNNLQLSLDVGFKLASEVLIPTPFVTGTFRYTGSDHSLRLHVINKVVQYPAIKKSTRILKDGIYHTEEYLAFNPENGQPVIAYSRDGSDGLALEQAPSTPHKGTYISYSIPASHRYTEMGQIASNIHFSGNATLSQDTVLTLPGATEWGRFVAGDLVQIISGSKRNFYHIARKASSPVVHLNPVSYNDNVTLTGGVVSFEILFSGRSNQLGAQAGSFTTYGLDKSDALTAPSLSTINAAVLTADAQQYSDYWPYDESVFGAVAIPGATGTPNDFEKGIRGHWRPVKNYVYRQSVQAGVGGTNRSYKDAGVLSSFTQFNWSNPGSNGAEWLALTTVDSYSPNGEPLQETNILGIPSAARFAHRNTVPSVVAKNAEYKALFFESFEDGAGNTSLAHTGASARTLSTSSWYTVGSLTGSSRLSASGLSVKYWVSSGVAQPCSVKVGSTTVVPAAAIAQAGEWKLYEAKIASGVLSASGTLSLEIKGTVSGVVLDDLRAQPLDAMATCYTYDAATLRLLAQFDDQHFALLYQYNAEGKLIRKIKETERGVKTVQETQYHTPELARGNNTFVGGYGLATNDNSGGKGSALHHRNGTNDAGVVPPESGVPIEDVGGNVDLFRLNLTPDKATYRIFGSDSLTVPPLLAPPSGDSLLRKAGKNIKVDSLDGRFNPIDTARLQQDTRQKLKRQNNK